MVKPNLLKKNEPESVARIRRELNERPGWETKYNRGYLTEEEVMAFLGKVVNSLENPYRPKR